MGEQLGWHDMMQALDWTFFSGSPVSRRFSPGIYGESCSVAGIHAKSALFALRLHPFSTPLSSTLPHCHSLHS
jgi:hypothetical protein